MRLLPVQLVLLFAATAFGIGDYVNHKNQVSPQESPEADTYVEPSTDCHNAFLSTKCLVGEFKFCASEKFIEVSQGACKQQIMVADTDHICYCVKIGDQATKNIIIFPDSAQFCHEYSPLVEFNLTINPAKVLVNVAPRELQSDEKTNPAVSE
ncbi:hypothetical protein IWQ61_003616 [Dispira simplex]|nr:hypothetical protein IWQ61_003616 [Dispira simplex]